MGFGWIVVVGIDPAQVAETGSAGATRAVWAGITEHALRDWRGRMPKVDAKAAPTGYSAGFYEDSPSMSFPVNVTGPAKIAILNHVADVPRFGNSIFFALAAGLLVLAFFVGPLDALVLRRVRARQHSWATCLVWIILASVLAYWLPMLLRSGPTRINRVSVVDAIMLAPGSGSQGADNSPSLAWTTAYTGVYAASTSRASLTDPQESAGRWWRGASAQVYMPYSRQGRAGTVVNTFGQSLPDFSSLGSDAKVGAAGAGGNTLLPGTFKVWTFRMFVDQARSAWPIGISVRPVVAAAGVDDDALQLTITGVPGGAVLHQAAACINGTWFSIPLDVPVSPQTVGTEAGGAIDLRLARVQPGTAEQVWLGKSWDALQNPAKATTKYTDQYLYSIQRSRGDEVIKRPGVAFDLVGPDRRTQLVHDLCQATDLAQHWGVVFIRLRGMPAEVQFPGEAAYSHDTIARVLVPIDPAAAQWAASIQPAVSPAPIAPIPATEDPGAAPDEEADEDGVAP